jgi:hypothetical protein
LKVIQLRKSKHEFLKRLDMYNELKFSEKERAKIDTNVLLKEFEKTTSEKSQEQLEPITSPMSDE